MLDVHASHFTGARADGLIEDYHGIHLIFDACVLPESAGVEPRVVEEDGSTDHVAWVRLSRRRTTWSCSPRHGTRSTWSPTAERRPARPAPATGGPGRVPAA